MMDRQVLGKRYFNPPLPKTVIVLLVIRKKVTGWREGVGQDSIQKARGILSPFHKTVDIGRQSKEKCKRPGGGRVAGLCPEGEVS